MEKKLGFEKIFKVGPAFEGKPSQNKEHEIFFGYDKSWLLTAVKENAKAIAIMDFYIDKKLMAEMKERETILCIPFCHILSRNGIDRSKLLYKASALVKYASSSRIKVSFASLADSDLFLNSKMQLIELSKAIGAKEEHARDSLCAVNKELGETLGKD